MWIHDCGLPFLVTFVLSIYKCYVVGAAAKGDYISLLFLALHVDTSTYLGT